MNSLSALWLLTVWGFITRGLIATMLSTYPCIFSCIGVNGKWVTDTSGQKKLIDFMCDILVSTGTCDGLAMMCQDIYGHSYDQAMVHICVYMYIYGMEITLNESYEGPIILYCKVWEENRSCYSRLSIYCSSVTATKLTSYGMSYASNMEKSIREISRMHCLMRLYHDPFLYSLTAHTASLPSTMMTHVGACTMVFSTGWRPC